MHEPLLALAALPAPAAVCGIPLRPYSLGHELFLIREQSPFVFGGDVLPGDLLNALWICSGTFEDARDAIHSWSYLPKIWLYKRRVNRCHLEWESTAFRAYRADGLLEFPLSEIANANSGPTPRLPGSPSILRLNQFLMTHCGKTEAEAWDYPAGLAKMRWQSFYEQEGAITVRNFHDEAFDQYIAEQEAKGKEALCRRA